MARIVFSDTGLSVHLPDPAQDPNYAQRGQIDYGDKSSLQGRTPVIYHPDQGRVYVGNKDWYHADAYDHHGLENDGQALDGYFGGGPEWGNGDLKWWHTPPDEDHQAVAKTLQQAGFQIPNPDSARGDDDFDYEDAEVWGDDPWEDA